MNLQWNAASLVIGSVANRVRAVLLATAHSFPKLAAYIRTGIEDLLELLWVEAKDRGEELMR